MSLKVDFTQSSFNTQKNCQALIEAPGFHVNPSLLLGWLSQSASWVIFEVTGLCTPMWCRWAHPHSGPSRSSFIRPSEWPHSSPSPQLVTLCLCRGPRTNFSLFLLPDLPRTTHLSHASLLFWNMWWLKLQGSSLAANYLKPTNRWNVTNYRHCYLCISWRMLWSKAYAWHFILSVETNMNIDIFYIIFTFGKMWYYLHWCMATSVKHMPMRRMIIDIHTYF